MTPPFPGDSDEVRAIVRYLASTGIPHVVTSTTNHGQHTSTGNQSRHVQPGTHGNGLAVDFAERIGGGRDTHGLLAIRNALIPVQKHCFEIIYAGPGHPDNIKRGHPYAYPKVVMDGHHTHVHVSVDRGVLLEPSPSQKVRPMYDPPIRTGPIVADAYIGTTQQHYLLDENGGIYTFGGAPFHGAPSADPRVPHGTKFARLEADSAGYTAISVDGSRFGYPHA
jgi:hypothetical protein